jgi:hypothetical protein
LNVRQSVIPLDDKHLGAFLGEVVGKAGPNNSTANHDDIRSLDWKLRLTNGSRQVWRFGATVSAPFRFLESKGNRRERLCRQARGKCGARVARPSGHFFNEQARGRGAISLSPRGWRTLLPSAN